MILATHAMAGGAVAFWLRQDPALALAGAFVSHFLLDVPPHWHYSLRAFPREGPRAPFRSPQFARALAATAADALIGTGLALLLASWYAPSSWPVVLLGASAGVLPDFFQLLYHAWPKFPFRQFHSFHKWIHAKRRLDDRPLAGIGSQLLLILVLAWLWAAW